MTKHHLCFVFHSFFSELDHDALVVVMENLKTRWGRQRDREGRGGDARQRNPDADAGLWRKTGRRRWREPECVRVEGLKKKEKEKQREARRILGGDHPSG